MNRVLTCAVLAVATSACGARHQAAQDACNAARSELAAGLAAEKERSAELGDRNQRLAQSLEDAEYAARSAERELAAAVADRQRLAASRAELESALADARARQAEVNRGAADVQHLRSQLDALVGSKLEVKLVDRRVVLAMAADALFAAGSTELSEAGDATIADVARALAGIEGRRIDVEASAPSSLELGTARAVAVARRLNAAGIPGSSLSAASRGGLQGSGGGEERIEIVLN